MPECIGPTSATVSPNPYTDSLSFTWSGLKFNGSGWKDKTLIIRFRTSPDNKTWGDWYPETYASFTDTLAGKCSLPGKYKGGAERMKEIREGYYVEFSLKGYGYANSSNIYGDTVYVKTQKAFDNTPCTAPTSVSVKSEISEGDVTLSWSGAAEGRNTPISGYEIQYSDSADNSSWGDWTKLTTVSTSATSGSAAVSPPPTRGHYRRFQVRTLTEKTAYISGWTASSNSVRRNTLPSAPTSFTASPEQYTTEDISLKWSGAAGGTSSIKQYVIQKAESPDNKTWGSWQNVQTVVSAETSGSITVTPTRTVDMYTLYRICTQDALDCVSTYKNSNSVYALALPFAPTVTAPKDKAATYSRNPRILIQTVAPPGAREQTVFVKATDGVTYNSVDHSDMFSVSGTSTGTVKTVFINPDTEPGQYSVSVHCKTADVGPAVMRSFSVAASPFAGMITTGAPVKAVHIAELRSAANAVRNYYGLAAHSFTPIIPGRTNISYWPYHIFELRAALEAVFDLLSKYGGNRKLTWRNVGKGRPRADVMNQLQDVICGL
jgi:hypothetical protein